MAQSREKPKKPYSDFPLTAHATGQWCKKINGKIHYFGSDAQAALRKYLDLRDEIQAGRVPKSYNPDGCSLRELVNTFLTVKQNRVDSGELSPLTFGDYHRMCQRLLDHFGRERTVSCIGPADFERLRSAVSVKLGPTALGDFVRRSRVLFKFAYDAELVEKPIRYGQSFSEPSKKIIRRVRQQHQEVRGLRMFKAEEIRLMLDSANEQLKAAILLGINCGFGATDIALLPIAAIDFENGWINFPRPKTSVERRIPLWQMTQECLAASIKDRPSPADPENERLCFLTSRGTRLVRPSGRTRVDVLSRNFESLMKRLKIKRPGLAFYALRHTLATVASETRDQVAIDTIMGHVDQSMAASYREVIGDGRLKLVTEYVHDWLSGGTN